VVKENVQVRLPNPSIATLADHADLDGHLLLADDPFDGIACHGSIIELGEAPGLGVSAK